MRSGITLRRRDQIICTLDSALPDEVTVTKHGGEIDAVQLAKYGADAPAVLVTSMQIGGIDRVEGTGDIGFGIFIVTSDRALEARSELDRSDQAHLLTEAIISLMVSAKWHPTADPNNPQPSDCVDGPRNIVASNLFDDDIDDDGIAMWGIVFTENAELLSSVYDDLVDLETLWTSTVPTSDPDTTTPNLEWDALPEIP